MPRLSSIEKGGFAFPDEHLVAVVSYSPAPDGGDLLDPVRVKAALQRLAAWQLTPYANELDTDRAADAGTVWPHPAMRVTSIPRARCAVSPPSG
jgi:hypothetical protein